MRSYLMFMMLMIISIPCFGQKDHWQIKLRNGELITEGVFHVVKNDTLILLNSGPMLTIPVKEIVEVRNSIAGQKRRISILGWVGIGAIAGTAAALISYSATEANKPPPQPATPGALIGEFDFGPGIPAIAGSVVGGLVGLVVGGSTHSVPVEDKVYDFNNMSEGKKLRVLSRLLPKHK